MKAIILHPIEYDARPRGHEPDHFAHIGQTLTSRGHSLLNEGQYHEMDVLIFNSGVWHIDAKGTTSPYNWIVLNHVLHNRIPVVYMDDFDHAGDDKSIGRWPGIEDWKDLKGGPDGDWSRFGWEMSRPGMCQILYFMRKMQIHQNYPHYVHPLEYPLLEDFPIVSKEELCSRPNDVCGLANISLPRAMSMLGLAKHNKGRLKLDLEIIPHYRRIDYYEWLNRHRQAKLFLDADASLGSERSLRLITIAPMLRVKSDHRLPVPRQDLKEQVEIGTYDGYVTEEDVLKIERVVKDPDLLYSIYVQGVEHAHKHLSLQARSNYVVDLMEKFVKGEI